jgi:lambda family phage tail tape measure protein
MPKSAADREAREAARTRAEAERELAEAVKQVADAQSEFTTRSEDLADSIEGPLAVANRAYNREVKEFETLAGKGEISADKLKDALDDLATAHAKNTEEIERQLNPGRELIADMEFALQLTKMQTDAERDRAIFLRENINATEDQADAYARVRQEIQETDEAIAAADQLRDHFADAFSSILDGTKSAKEAFSDLADAIISDIARMIARQWVEQLLGGFGTPAGGAGGGLLSFLLPSAKGNAFGAGRVIAMANGGIVNGPTLFPMANGMGLMGEAGPEAVMPLARDRQGRLGVRGGGGGFVQTLNFNGYGKPDQRTKDQFAATAGREARRAMARNG